MSDEPFVLRPIGIVRSSLRHREDAPRQGNEGAPEAWVDIESKVLEALKGIEPGVDVILITWFHQAK